MKRLRPTTVISLLLLLPAAMAWAENPPEASSEETSGAVTDESPEVESLIERGNQLLAEQQYDEARKEFGAAHKLKPNAETYVGIAMAMLRGRRVLRPGDMCNPATFRAELEAHRDEEDQPYGVTCHSVFDPISDRHYEINSAVHQLDLAAKLVPQNVAVYEKLTHAKIALLQFDEEAACRQTTADVRYGTESDFGRINRMDSFELPSLMVLEGAMYPMQPTAGDD